MEELNLVVSARRLGARPDRRANHAMIANSSGDTRYNENMVDFSSGADLLIHRHSRPGDRVGMPCAFGTS
jgi:hypothetical protein